MVYCCLAPASSCPAGAFACALNALPMVRHRAATTASPATLHVRFIRFSSLNLRVSVMYARTPRRAPARDYVDSENFGIIGKAHVNPQGVTVQGPMHFTRWHPGILQRAACEFSTKGHPCAEC